MLNTGLRSLLLAVLAGSALTACGEVDSAFAPDASGNPPGTNTAPEISGSPATGAIAGATWSFKPTASDRDGDALTFQAAGLPSWASINPQTGLISGIPQESDVGTTAGITVSVSDGKASDSLPEFQVAVVPGESDPPPPPPPNNTAPVISGTPPTTVQATLPYGFTPAASDAQNQALTFSIANKPVWASFSTSTGRLSGTPTGQQVTTFSNIVISVSDGSLSTALPAFSITVTAPPNRAPTISGTPTTSITAGSAYSFNPTASDPDGQTLTYSIVNKPSWASFNASSGRLSGTPATADAGNTTSGIVITASDGSLSASLPAFAIAVTATPNRVPTISGAPTTSVVTGSNYSFTPTASDPDGDSLSFSITGKPSWASFSTATGALTGQATTGIYANIVISVHDGTVTRSLPAFTLNVTSAAPTGTATLSWDPPTQYTDGSTLPASALTGYRVYHGTSVDALDDVMEVSGAATTTYVVDRLLAGTHYFAVTAVTTSGSESAPSMVGSKTIL